MAEYNNPGFEIMILGFLTGQMLQMLGQQGTMVLFGRRINVVVISWRKCGLDMQWSNSGSFAHCIAVT